MSVVGAVARKRDLSGFSYRCESNEKENSKKLLFRRIVFKITVIFTLQEFIKKGL